MNELAQARLDCERVDELAGAVTLGALDADEARAVADHLASCERSHAGLHELAGAREALASAVDPVTPDPSLRAKVLASAATTTQDPRLAPPVEPRPAAPPLPAGRERGGWFAWLSPARAGGLLGVAGVAVVALLVWNVTLQQQLTARDRALEAVANVLRQGQPAHAVSGTAGSGYVVDTPGPGATFLAAGLEALPAGQIYELWLIDASGSALAVGVIETVDAELTVAAVDEDLGAYAAFAVTIEAERVAAPTDNPVLVGPISS